MCTLNYFLIDQASIYISVLSNMKNYINKRNNKLTWEIIKQNLFTYTLK